MLSNTSLLKRMRVRLNFQDDLVANWNLPFPNWLHLIDPLRTSTIGQVVAAISSKWQPSSPPSSTSSSSIYLSIGGYRLNLSDTVDILRDDDVVDVLSMTTPAVSNAHTHHQQSFNALTQQQNTHKSYYKRRLSIHHADRSGFGLDVGDEVDYSHGASAPSKYESYASAADSATPTVKRKAGETDYVEAKAKKQRKYRRDANGVENGGLNVGEMAVSSSIAANGVAHGNGDAAIAANEESAAADAGEKATDDSTTPVKRKKRSRKAKKNKGFDLTLPHGGVSRWETIQPQPAVTKIPFKISKYEVTSSGGKGPSHIVFGEGDEGSFNEGSLNEGMEEEQPASEENEGQIEDEVIPSGQVEEEATEEEEEEEEEQGEETEEMKKEKAIGDEDVNAWDPISEIPKEGDIVAFKVMEMDDHYCPQISDFKVGVVKSNAGGKDRLQIRLFNFTRKKNKGKFEMRLKKKKKGKKVEEEGEVEEEEKEKEEGEELVTENQVRKTSPEMTIQWTSVIEPKLRPADPTPAAE